MCVWDLERSSSLIYTRFETDDSMNTMTVKHIPYFSTFCYRCVNSNKDTKVKAAGTHLLNIQIGTPKSK